MDKNNTLNLLEYKIKVLHMMITSMDNFKYDFFSFVIDHDINEYQTSLILKSLTILDDRLNEATVSDFTKSICEEKKELTSLIINSKPSYIEFKSFIESITNNVNVIYLIKSLKNQQINVKVCEFLLDDSNKNVNN